MLYILLFRNVALLSAVALFVSGCQLAESVPAVVRPANETSERPLADDLADHVAQRVGIARTQAAGDGRSATRLRFPVKPAQDRAVILQAPTVGISTKNEMTETRRQDLPQQDRRPGGIASVNSGIQRGSKITPVPIADSPIESRNQPGAEPPLPEPIAVSFRTGNDSATREDVVTTLAAHFRKNELSGSAEETLGDVNLRVPRFGQDEKRQVVPDRPDLTNRVSHARQFNADAFAAHVKSADRLSQSNDDSKVAGKSGELKWVELVSDESSLPSEPAGLPQISPQPENGNADSAAAAPGVRDDDAPSVEFPIDLPTALRLAGADNWSIRLATERVREAQARYDAARVLWLPSLNAGLGYTKHDGQIQDTRGEVIDVSRNSLFAGGGAAVGNSALAGGSGGPARLQVDLSLADALFEPLAACQLLRAAQANESVTFNDTLLGVALAYFDLVDAQGQLAIARQNLDNANEVLSLTEGFVAAGKGSRADTARARVEATLRQQAVIDARMRIEVASAELARLIQLDPDRLDPRTLLVALDAVPVPVELVSEATGLSELISQGLRGRPEMAETQALLEAGRQRARAERWRPLIPNVHVGASAGGFGGGVNDELHQLDGRGDFDVLAVWELRNLGYGTHAAISERSSQFRQSLLGTYQVRDLIATEIKSAYHQVHAQRRQLELSESNVRQAEESYRQNITRIRGLEGLPLEAIQALHAVAAARSAFLAATIDYNRAQAQLLRAIGQPVSQ